MKISKLLGNPILIISFVMFVLLIFSCKKEKEKEVEPEENTAAGTKTIHGAAQKGPYKSGAPITIYELNSSMGQTGKSFASTINDDAGNFSLNSISLTSNYILITASGYYFNEHFNRTSEGQLYLESFADVSTNSVVNINILTHILKPRIEQLISTGSNFNTAQTQAQNEFLTIVGASGSVSSNFESLDITNDGFLFAMSLLFQRNNSYGYNGYNYTAELSALLSNFRNDFANNGLIDNHNLIDTLVYNASRVDLIDCKDDTYNYYSGLGLAFTGNNFETHLYNFQKKYTTTISTVILYPTTSAIMIDAPGSTPPYSERENILDLNKKSYNTSAFQGQLAISAIVPYDSVLIVKITPYNSTISIDPSSCFGWKWTQINQSTLFEAQRKNVPLSYLIGCGGDSAKIEYFNNSSGIPFYSKNITFN